MTALALLLALTAAQAVAPVASPAADSSHAATEAAIVDAAQAALAEAWPDVAPQLAIRVVRLSGGAERVRPPVRVRFLDAGVPRGRASAEVEAADGAGWARAGWALLDVAHTATAAVLVRPLARGEAVTPDAYRLDAVETTRMAEAPLAPDSLVGWSAGRPLAAGTVLTARVLARPVAADAGAAVRVRYRRGAVQIAFEGVARERGAVGETIRVYDSATRRTHRVRLTAPGEGAWLSTL